MLEIKCEFFDEIIEKIFSGEASPDEEKKFFDHISKCATCKKRWDSFVKCKTFFETEQERKKCRKRFTAVALSVSITAIILSSTIPSFKKNESFYSPNSEAVAYAEDTLESIDNLLSESFVALNDIDGEINELLSL